MTFFRGFSENHFEMHVKYKMDGCMINPLKEFSKLNSLGIRDFKGKKFNEKLERLSKMLTEISGFSINGCYLPLDRNLKLQRLASLLSKVTKKVGFFNFTIKSRCFQKIFIILRQICELEFGHCYIDTNKFDLSTVSPIVKFEVSELILWQCTEIQRSIEISGKFEMIFIAISKSTLIDSLKQVKISYNSQPNITSKAIQSKYALQHINISLTPNFPFIPLKKPKKSHFLACFLQ
ncbi:unnamed protein product [Moneuplotes crassus]|uniref:Uncharacterized protein n=1 Tax=Euplotes crassus TaxID=5936 RepID=A0AAD1XTL6_EUPCR|nr:unnamed protein product [Moneuplotes crassus]